MVEHLSRRTRWMRGSKVGCPAWFQTTLVVSPLAWIPVDRMWCRVMPTFEGFPTNSSPLQLVNTWLRHVISGVADRWAALRRPCCNWLASSVTFKVIYDDIGLVSLSFSIFWNQTFIGIYTRYHMQHLSHGWYSSSVAPPCQNGDFDHEPGLRCNQIGKYHRAKSGSPQLRSPLSSSINWGNRCSSALVLLFMADQPGS